MRRRLVAALAAVVGLGLATAPSAEALRYPYKWHTRYVYYYDYTGRAEVRSGVNDWSRSNTGADLYVGRTFDKSKANIKMVWKDLPHPTAAWAPTAYSGDRIVSCTIELDVDLKGWSATRLRAIVAHEAGHCMGMAHTSYWWSVMSTASNKTTSYRPTQYDKNDMIAHYGKLG